MKRLCSVCGEEYDYCYSCEKTHSWRALADTAEHYYILTVLMDYQTDHDAVKAYRALRKRGVDLKDTAGYVSSVQALMSEVFTSMQSKNNTNKSPSSLRQNFTEKSRVQSNPDGDIEKSEQE